MNDQETQKQSDLRGLLEYQTTTTQSMIREIEDLKAIHFEQLQRQCQTISHTDGISIVSEDRYMELETLKADYQKRSDQVLAIKREIAQRTRDFGQLREEVTQR